MQTFHEQLFLAAATGRKDHYLYGLACLTKVTLTQLASLKGAPSWGGWPSLAVK